MVVRVSLGIDLFHRSMSAKTERKIEIRNSIVFCRLLWQCDGVVTVVVANVSARCDNIYLGLENGNGKYKRNQWHRKCVVDYLQLMHIGFSLELTEFRNENPNAKKSYTRTHTQTYTLIETKTERNNRLLTIGNCRFQKWFLFALGENPKKITIVCQLQALSDKAKVDLRLFCSQFKPNRIVQIVFYDRNEQEHE